MFAMFYVAIHFNVKIIFCTVEVKPGDSPQQEQPVSQPGRQQPKRQKATSTDLCKFHLQGL